MVERGATSRAVVLILLGVFLAYSPIWQAGYVYEDRSPIMTPNSGMLVSIWPTAPLREIDPRVSHGVNLAVHLVNGWLVYLLVRRWLSVRTALLAAGVFWLHPIQTEAVAQIAQRSELVMTTCVLVAVHVALKPYAAWRLLIVAVMACLAATAKLAGVAVFPAVALAWWVRGERLTRLEQTVVGGALVALGWQAHWVLQMEHVTSEAQHGLLGFVSTQAAAWWRLLGIVLLPLGQTVHHDFATVTPATGLAALVGLLVWGGCVWGLRHRSALAVALCWPLAILGPRLLVRSPEYLSEHHFYLPMVAFAALGAWGLNALGKEQIRGRERLHVG